MSDIVHIFLTFFNRRHLCRGNMLSRENGFTVIHFLLDHLTLLVAASEMEC